MSNIDDDAPELELEDLNMANDGMPDPTAAEPVAEAGALEAAEEPVSLDDVEPVEDSLESAEAEEEKKSSPKKAGAMAGLTKSSPYTVMLALSVLAIGIALLCLLMEWSSFGFQRKPPKNITMSRVESTQFAGVFGISSRGSSLDPDERRTS